MRHAPSERYVRFPPRQHNILLPARPVHATARSMSLYTACKPHAVATQWILWTAARVGVLRAARTTGWTPPFPADQFQSLRQSLARELGWSPDCFAIYERIQPGRPSLTMLVIRDSDAALVRVRPSKSSLEREQQISDAAQRMRPTTFRVPRVVAEGEVYGRHWIAYEPISRAPHRPVRHLRPGLTEEVRALVESVVPRPNDIDAMWRGAHGDLTPWNLRRGSRGIWLIDWEDAGWAPAGADEVYFNAVMRSISRRGSAAALPVEHREAAAYWTRIVESRPIAPSERSLKSRLLGALASE